jgi:phosphatidylserine decarboxylase
VWTARSLRVAGRYAAPPLLAGTGLAAAGRRRAAAAALGLAATVVLFFRDPARRPAAGETDVVYAVTDGRVMLVRDGVHVPWLPGGPYHQVSVFLTLADVHVARSPASGKMISWTWRDGRGRAAMRQAAEDENRQARITIETEAAGDAIGVVLIAGLIARRITQWALPGPLTPGRRLGIIHFGSRSILYLPEARYELLVTKATRLHAGRTPVARRMLALTTRHPVGVMVAGAAGGCEGQRSGPQVTGIRR